MVLAQDDDVVRAVGPEKSCGFPEVVVMQPMDRRELDDLARFG